MHLRPITRAAKSLSGLPVRQAEQELQHTDGSQLSRRETRTPVTRVPVGEVLVVPQPVQPVSHPYRRRAAGVARPRDLRSQRRDLLTGTRAEGQRAPQQLHRGQWNQTLPFQGQWNQTSPFDLAELSLLFGFGDSGNQVVANLDEAVSLSRIRPKHGASDAGIRCPVLQMDPRQRPRLLEIIQNLRERIREACANGWLGEVEGLQVSFDAAMAKLNSLKRAPTDGRPHLVDLGMPVFTDHAPRLQPGSGEPGFRP